MSGRTDSNASRLVEGDRFLGRFTIEKTLAEGGMASVHLARDERTGRRLAVKCLYSYYAANETVRTRFIDEGRIQKILDHPNIVSVYEVVEQPILSILMEFIQGPTLDEYLKERGSMATHEVIDFMLPVLSAIGFAHNRGIIHRDIKPSNILLMPTPQGLTPKIMDFGVAKIERGRDLTETGTTLGTLHYMSPEQIVGAKHIDGRADIYSLGVTMYKLVTGEVPFNAGTEFALMMAQVEAQPMPPRKLQPSVSPSLEKIILKALEKKPERRFQSIRAFTQALLEVSGGGRQAGSQTDTDTAPIPENLLEHAMSADEVAQDRTSEYEASRLAAGDSAAGTSPERPSVRPFGSQVPDEEGLDATMTMNLDRLLRRDADRARDPDAPQSGTSDTGSDTTPQKARVGKDTLSDATTETFKRERFDKTHDRPNQSRSLAETSSPSEEATAPVVSEEAYNVIVGESAPTDEQPQRTIASKSETTTSTTGGDDVEDLSRAQWAVIIAGLTVIVVLSTLVVWALVTQ